MTAPRYARIASVGTALPSRVVPNAYFEGFLDTSDAWIADRTGIRERRFAGPTETTGSLAAEACARALERAGAGPETVDLLIVATCTPDRLMPSTAAFVQARLRTSAPAFDLNAACAGFVYALAVGAAHIRAGAADRVLVVGSEVLSRVLDMTDRTTCVLFGDGAGAVLLEPGAEPGVVDSLLALDGSQAELLTIPAGGTEEPATEETVRARRHFLKMLDGQSVFREAVTSMAEVSRALLDKAGVAPEELRWVIGHQANARILAALGKRLGIPDRVFLDIERTGNTSAASIPLAMDRAWREGSLAPGDLVLTVAFGAGMAWGANLVRWTAPAPAGASERSGGGP
ncbi:MAG TPA: beta-ketoacyl-ACP synthase III [Actinomycetota bacterium]|nr:beta-ketoacyl-ACP synthase III [Actinomycetota bacterium]